MTLQVATLRFPVNTYISSKFFQIFLFSFLASIDEEFCGCQVPCSQTKYTTEVSYSRFPDAGTADAFVTSGYYADVQYQR